MFYRDKGQSLFCEISEIGPNCVTDPLKSDPTRSIVVIWVIFFQTELMVEIYNKSLVRAIGKVVLMTFS